MVTKMTRTALLFAILALTSTGCGNSETQQTPGKTADDTSKLCPAIAAAGLAKQCRVDTGYGSVDVVVDSFDDEVARNACAHIADKLSPLTAQLSGPWKLQIFSPYRSDKPTATCVLH